MSAPRVKITIDRMVLRGFDPAQRDALVAGLKAELARQFAAQPGFASEAASRSVAAAKATVDGDSSSAQLFGVASGRQLFQTITGSKP